MRITGQDPFIIDVPDAAVTSPGPSPTVDLGALDGAEALALAEAASAVTNTLPTSQITWVRTAAGSPNQDLQLAFAVTPTSGPVVLLPFRQEDITDGTTLRTGNMAIMGWATLAPGDVVDLRVRNRTAANNVTWIHGQVLVEQVGN